MGTSSSYASIVEEQCLRTDEELDLMNEVKKKYHGVMQTYVDVPHYSKMSWQ